MLSMDFAGSRQLIDAIDAAVAERDTASVTNHVRASLCGFMASGSVKLPECVFTPCAEHYARRELYRSDAHGYCVVAMTWGPGQGTPIHDHDGMWCVEGVWHGALDIRQFEPDGRDGEEYRFKPVRSIHAAAGSAGSLIPPHEYHAIHNAEAAGVTVSLHVYAGPMLRCSVFEPLPDGHAYRRSQRVLALDRTG